VIGCMLGATPAAAQPDEEEIEIETEIEPTKPQPQAAEPVQKDPKAAKRWAWTGKQLIAKGNYMTRSKKPDEARVHFENAVEAFTKAIELGDDPAVYLELAESLDKLGKFDEAARNLRLLTKIEGLRADIAKKALARYDEATTKVGLVTLNVKPDGATIALGGLTIATAPLAEPLILLPGTYMFQLAAEGFQPLETEIKIEAGSESERGLELQPVEIVIDTRPRVVDDEPITPPPPPPEPSKLPLYVGGGATALLAATATITGILAVGQHGTFTSVESSAAEREDARTRGRRLARISDVTTVGALLAGGFTAYWYVLKYRPAQRKLATEDRAKLTVVPWVQPTGDHAGGLSLTGSF
jgi:hypothetical protein